MSCYVMISMVNNMSLRMDKYSSSSDSSMSRTKRNQDIYNSTDMGELSRFKANTNVSVISDAHKGIDIEKIKRYIYENQEEDGRKRISLELPVSEEVVIERREEKEYDINAVLEKARDKREINYEEERHRKLNNTQIDILKTIKIKESQIEEIDDDITGPIDELNTQEKTIVDLIKNIKDGSSKKDDLFHDLMAGEGDSIVMAPIEEETMKDNIKNALMDITQEIENVKIPDTEFTQEINNVKYNIEEDDDDINPNKSFYTSSINFDKSDFEGFDDIEKCVRKGSFLTKLGIVFMILMLIGTVVVLLNSFLGWGLF